MTKLNFLELSEAAIKSLKKIASFQTYSTDVPLHYQGQVPIVAYLISKGTILLIKNDKVCHKLTKGSVIGYRELQLNMPSPFTAQTQGSTEIYYIDKSTLLEIENSKKPEMHQLQLELTHL